MRGLEVQIEESGAERSGLGRCRIESSSYLEIFGIYLRNWWGGVELDLQMLNCGLW